MQLEGFYVEGLDTSVPPDQNDRVPELNIPKTWNASSDVYALRYKHPRSAMVFDIKMVPIGQRLFIHGMAIEDGKHYELELKVDEYVRGGMWEDDSAWNDLFYPNKLKDLISLFRMSVVRKMLPELNKEGYEDTHTTTATPAPATTTTTAPESRPAPRRDPYDDPLRDDSFRRPRMPPVPPVGGRNPLAVGQEDLYPLGMPRFGPGGFPGMDTGGGMLFGPTHPAFGPGVRDPYAFQPPSFPGGPVGIPRGSIPPGARFDPFGPPPVPGPFGPSPGSGFREPDNDMEPPPGMYW